MQLASYCGGLGNSKYVTVQEKVAMLLSILTHHTKNRSVTVQFKRSGQTFLTYFYSVLRSVLRLHSLFLIQPQPVPDGSTDPRWGKFKHCRLGPSCDHVIIMNGSYPKKVDSRDKRSPLDHIPGKNDSDQASYRLK
ncbi:hypothetical protein ACS0TY_033074 [Phlomoides rotata]